MFPKDIESKPPLTLVHFMGYENQPLSRECLNTTNNDISNKEVFIHKVTRRKSESESTPLKEPRCFSSLKLPGPAAEWVASVLYKPKWRGHDRICWKAPHCSIPLSVWLQLLSGFFFFFLLREQRWVPSHLMGYLLGPPLTLHFSSDLSVFCESLNQHHYWNCQASPTDTMHDWLASSSAGETSGDRSVARSALE